MIVSISGFIGSGKNAAAEYLVDRYNFRSISFASSLKDAVSAVFGWDRELLEGKTAESRAWREQVDQWWAARLNMPHLTPRWILQYWGTEVCRQGFHDDIWIASLENQLRKTTENVVISDARFPNELATIKKIGGISLRVVRGSEPEWYDLAIRANTGDQTALHSIKNLVHSSEWAWVGYNFDHVLSNNQSLEVLHQNLDAIIKNRV